MADYPPYIERGGQQVFRQPLKLTDVYMRNFVLDAERGALQNLCDKFLNSTASRDDVRYVPLASKVVLAFAEIGHATSLDQRDRQFGWLPEIDVAFWVPVAMLQRDGNDYRISDIAWFLPYVFVDNPWAMATGREIYGFSKELGRFEIPSGSDPARPFRVNTMVLDPHTPDTRAREETILEVQGEGAAEADGHRSWDDVVDVFQELVGTVFGAADLFSLFWHEGVNVQELTVNLYERLRRSEVPLVFLKQFRDVSNPQRACYRKLIRACADLDDGSITGAGPMWGDYTLMLNDYASHPIARDLGLNVGANRIDEAFWARYAFTMKTGEEL